MSIPDIDDIDFISLYQWLWHRHKEQILSLHSLVHSADSYFGLFYNRMPQDDINVKMVKALIDMGFMEEVLDSNSNPSLYFKLIGGCLDN